MEGHSDSKQRYHNLQSNDIPLRDDIPTMLLNVIFLFFPHNVTLKKL